MSKSSFLPFIKETSSEDAIFKAILKRAKGSSFSAISNLLSVVLSAGIESIRAKIDNLDDNLTTSAKVSEVVAQESIHHIPQSSREYWNYVSKYFKPKTTDFTDAENEIFFTVLAAKKPESLEKNGFIVEPELLKKLTKYSDESADLGIRSISGIEISSEDSQRIGFTCWVEFKAFLAMKSTTNTVIKIIPTYIKTSASVVTDHIYSENHCVSPYVGITNET